MNSEVSRAGNMSHISISLAAHPPPLVSKQITSSHFLSRNYQPTIIAPKPRLVASVSLNSILSGCKTCRGTGATECPGCKGTGRNKKNGNIFERWKCFECQGFGLKSCPTCGKGGLTPEQRGER